MDTSDIGALTTDETSHFRERGGAKLDGLLAPDLANELLERAKNGPMGPSAADNPIREGFDLDFPWWHDFNNVIEADEAFAAVGLSAAMRSNAQHLLRRRTGMLSWSNRLGVKVGAGQQTTVTSEATTFHQDGPEIPMDRASWVRFWIALDDVTPDMGTMRFVDRSHLLGLVGNAHFEQEDLPPDEALFHAYPELAEMNVTDLVHFRPGDATVHSMYTLHAGPANTTDSPRWALIYSYFEDDTVYTGSRCEDDNMGKLQRAGVVSGQRFADAGFLRVCEVIDG
jgi:Phytanoyl-CoA dioxygenase (PhyH)